jgi:hypothetical protein
LTVDFFFKDFAVFLKDDVKYFFFTRTAYSIANTIKYTFVIRFKSLHNTSAGWKIYFTNNYKVCT